MRNFVVITNIRTYKSMKKFILDLTVKSVTALSDKHVLIKLTDDKPLPEMLPGQFVEVRVDQSPSTFLRRPISINFVEKDVVTDFQYCNRGIEVGTHEIG